MSRPRTTTTPPAAARPAALVAALALSLLAAGGCTLFRERGIEERVAFSQVRPPVAFEMLRDAPATPLIDLREPTEFGGSAGHIKGARNLPLAELPERLQDLAPLKDRTFLVYCDSRECGERALEILLQAGYREAILMHGGIDAWLADGFGTVTGPPPPMEFPAPDSTRVEVE